MRSRRRWLRPVVCPKQVAMNRYARLCLLALLAAADASVAHADDAQSICTDRPSKGDAPCTVPAGRWQLETDLGNFTHDAAEGSMTTLYFLNPTLKYGIGGQTDIEVNWAPAIRRDTTTHGERTSTTGTGDLYLRLKTQLHADDVFSASVIPFFKAPTASHGIGNGRWEGGVALPVSAVVGGFRWTLEPELDALADAHGHGRHPAVSGLINVSHALTDTLTVAVEYWRQKDNDPSGHVTQASGDVSLAYLVNPNVQLDLGANLGLNRATPDQQVYFGLSYRW